MKNNNVDPSYKFAIFILSFIYAFILTSYIPMDGSIKDRLNYLDYAGGSEVILLRNLSSGYLSLLTNEPVWLAINIILNQLFEPEMTLRIIIFFTAFTTAFLVLNFNPKFFVFLIFILLVPQVIGKTVVHIRQGFAISIFLLGWFSNFKPSRWFIFALTPLIHSSFFFVLFLYGFVWFLNKLKFAMDLKTIAVFILALTLGLGLGSLAATLGVRQADEYSFSTTEVSGVGFLFWLGVFVLYWFQGRKFAKENAFAMSAITLYLTTYFLIEVTARIFESMLIIVLLASLGLTSWRRKIFILSIITFVCLTWLFSFNQPWLGWGTNL